MLSLGKISNSRLMSQPVAHIAKAVGDEVLERARAVLHKELMEAGLKHFRPTIYLGDEWFSPEGVPAIALPFYLAHPRLVALEREIMQTRAEGSTPIWFRRLLRHEAGHSFDHAYQVSRSPRFRKLFGDNSRRYTPDLYPIDQNSRNFVRHLPGYYAQSHPDEDFAETFAVCITPQLNWRKRYAQWPQALAKLEFVSEQIDCYADQVVIVQDRPLYFNACRMRISLATYYRKRLSAQATLTLKRTKQSRVRQN